MNEGSGAHLVIVPADAASAAAERFGRAVRTGWEATDTGWDLDDVVFAGAVESDHDATSVLRLLARGATVVVTVDDVRAAAFADECARIASVTDARRRAGAPPALSDDQYRLLELVASGASVAAAAAAVGLSERSAHRRLAAARAALHVRTTAEAIVAIRDH